MARKTAKKKTSTFDIITIGSAVQDVFLRSDAFMQKKDTHAPDGVDACFPMGSKLKLDEVSFDTGGGATNAGATFARLGFSTSCIVRLGKDIAGEAITRMLDEHGINASHIQIDSKLNTGYSAVLLSKEGHRSILSYRGASSEIDPKIIPWKSLKTDWLYLTSIAGKKTLLQSIFEHVRSKKIHVAWNPGGSELALGLEYLTPYILDCDILSLNREEAAELTNVSPRHIDFAIHRLAPLPRQALIITDGANGAYVHSRGVTWHAKTLKGKRVNTTGAGDAFGSGFVAGAIKTGNLEKALAIAMLNAHGVVTHMGAKNGILSRFPSVLAMKRVKITKI
ncbi:MAG: carbohydrate kinase family protein [bacterium]|nr:carbohydrate kinase family protein [bacterium]